MNKLWKLILVAAVVLAAAAIAGVAEPHLGQAATPSATTISVSGSGTVEAAPNQASFSFGVTTRAGSAAKALGSNARRARAIVSAIRHAGVRAAKIQTTDLSLWPRTRHRVITGYTASSSVQVTLPVAQAGSVVDAAVRAGAQNVSGPSLNIADQSALYDRALQKALSDAKRKAEAIATAAGLTLGAPGRVTESGEPTPIYAEKAALAAAPAPSIEAGTQQIEASVRVTYTAS